MFKKIGIVGLGLIGGSLAKALSSRYKAEQIVAFDLNYLSGEAALKEQTIQEFTQEDWQIFDGCDVVFVATPLPYLQDVFLALKMLDIKIITDVASLKQPALDMAKKVGLTNFVGGHPMAGSERTGYQCGSASLFENAWYVLSVPDSSLIPVGRINQLERVIKSLGASLLYLDGKEHDSYVAAISHLPHLVASGLSLLVAQHDHGEMVKLAAGGFKDITRIASADPDLWADISLASGTNLIEYLTDYIAILEKIKQNLMVQDKTAVNSFFSQGQFFRNKIPKTGSGALEAGVSLRIYLEDKPGSLSKITQILGDNQINIRNINIRDARAYEGGQVDLLLADSYQSILAFRLLEEAGYVCE